MKTRHITSLAALTLLGATALPLSVHAEEAKEGTASYTTYWVVGSYNQTMLDSNGYAIMDYSGVTKSDTPMFDHLTAHCLAGSSMAQGITSIEGACQGLAPDGSQLFLTYEIKNDGKSITGENHFVSGTGSFKGISGGGTISGLHLPGPDGKVIYVSQHEVKWKLQ